MNMNQKPYSVYSPPLEEKPEILIWILHLHLTVTTLIQIFQTREENTEPNHHLRCLFACGPPFKSVLTSFSY